MFEEFLVAIVVLCILLAYVTVRSWHCAADLEHEKLEN